MGKFKDISGQRFGRLVAIERVERNSSNKFQWLCKCDCGNMVKVVTGHLTSGHTQSCGCYNRDRAMEANTTHGKKDTRIYEIWCDMKKRCSNPNGTMYKYYGGRGITVCDEWKNDFQSFYDWSMANGYREDLSIDRIDNNGNYEPSNCRWATFTEQMNNMSSNHRVTVDGETKTIAQWAEYIGITRCKIDSAYRSGKDLEEYIRNLIKEKRV